MNLRKTLRAGRGSAFILTASILFVRKTARRQVAAFQLEGVLDYFSREITQSRVQSGELRRTEGERPTSESKRRKGVGSERAMICRS